MAQPYVGEVRMFAGNFAPAGWMFCNGAVLPISGSEVLFQLIGTTYGGDGFQTFALPNLQSRVPVHQGTGPGLSPMTIGETGGTETVTLTTQQIPIHTHAMNATGTAQQASPQNAIMATVGSTQAGANAYGVSPVTTPLVNSSIGPAGGSQPHENMQPTLFVSYIISLFGIFPSPT